MRRQIQISLSNTYAARLDQMCERSGLTRSELIRRWIDEHEDHAMKEIESLHVRETVGIDPATLTAIGKRRSQRTDDMGAASRAELGDREFAVINTRDEVLFLSADRAACDEWARSRERSGRRNELFVVMHHPSHRLQVGDTWTQRHISSVAFNKRFHAR